MSIWLAALLVPAALAAAEPSWRQMIREQAAHHTWTPIDKRYAEETVAALKALPETREHLDFVLAHGVDLQVVPPGDKLPGDAFGAYYEDARAMYINEDLLLQGVRELRGKGTPEADIPGVLAWKTVHIVAHEIRHGMTGARLARATGVRMRLKPLENEFISFVDELRVFSAVQRARPELWEDASRILEFEETTAWLLKALGQDLAELKKLVRVQPSYVLKPSLLETPREKLAAEYRRRDAELRGEVDELLRKFPDRVADPEVRAELEEYALSAADGLEFYRDSLRVLEDEKLFAALRRFYAGELAGAEERLRRARKP